MRHKRDNQFGIRNGCLAPPQSAGWPPEKKTCMDLREPAAVILVRASGISSGGRFRIRDLGWTYSHLGTKKIRL